MLGVWKMGEEEIENFPLRDIFYLIWSVKLFLYKFRSTYFPILKSKELPSLFSEMGVLV